MIIKLEKIDKKDNDLKVKKADVESNFVSLIPDNVEYLPDIEYSNANGKSLKLDLLYPSPMPRERLPALMHIHGGGWKTGSRKSLLSIHLAMEGFVVANIDYRLAGEAYFPAQLHDCKTAIRWLRANADRYNIDADNIGVWGGSAGGHLSGIVATTGDAKGLEGNGEWGEFSSAVQAAIVLCGPMDLRKSNIWGINVLDTVAKRIRNNFSDSQEIRSAFSEVDNGLDTMKRFLGENLQENDERFDMASPIKYVKPGQPPFLLIYGELDPIVPTEQGREFYKALQEAGTEATLIIINDENHGFAIRNIELLMPHITNFYNKHLKKTPSGDN